MIVWSDSIDVSPQKYTKDFYGRLLVYPGEAVFRGKIYPNESFVGYPLFGSTDHFPIFYNFLNVQWDKVCGIVIGICLRGPNAWWRY